MPDTRRVNLPRGCLDDLQRGVECVELLAQLSPPGVSDKKPCAFVDVAFHPLKPWVAAIEQRGCGVVWDYETGDVVTEFDLGESQVLDDDEAHGSEESEDAESATVLSSVAAPKGLLSRTTASPSTRSVQGAVAAANAAKGLLSPTGASLIKPRRRPSLQMLFYDHEAIACTTQLPASRTCFDEWLIIVARSHIVICDLDQNGAVHHLDPADLHRGLPSSVAILPSGLLAIGCQDGKIRIWSPWQSKTVGTLDSGSQRDVQQLILLTTPPILMKRSGSGALPGAETRLSTQLHHLACATLDGHVVTWRVALNASTASCDCVKTSEVELRDVFRQFDTVNGVHELKFHPQHDVMTAACRDGTIFFFDVAPLLDSNKPAMLTGLLPNSKLQSIIVLPGAQKGCFTALSISALNSTLIVSEIGVKGRYCGKDNVPTIFIEFLSSSIQESRDLRGFVNPMPKRLKMTSLTSSVRNPSEICCLTSYGLFVLRTSFLAAPTPIFLPRGTNNTPAIGSPSSMVVGVRILGENPQDQPQVHLVQNGAETQTLATIERSRVPQLHYSSWQNGFLAAILPISGHVEILQLGSKPMPPNAVDLETIFVAHAFGFAWHPSLPLFAVLAPNKELAGQLTRSNTASAIVPTKRSRFFFGGSRASAANATDEPDSRQQRAAARSLTLSIYKLSGDEAEVEFLETSFASGQDNLLHVFSGPLLGVAKYVADANAANPASLASNGAIVGRARDSPASLSRVQRAQSFMLGLSAISSPKMTDLRLTMISPLQSPSASPTGASFESTDSASDLTKTFLEFYEWSHVLELAEGEGGLRKLVGGFAVECPLSLEWDTATRSLCALVYPTSIKIYRFNIPSTKDQSKQIEQMGTSTMEFIHEIPTPSPAFSLYWEHHTLFFTSEDEVKCSVISKPRCFTLALASRWVLNEASCVTQVSDDDLNQFPRPQIFPAGATTILGVLDQKLVLGGPLQAVHILDLSNRVLQCAMLVTAGAVERAAELAQSLCPDAIEWLGAVFEAFGHVSEALHLLPGLSLSLKVNMCIKHAQLDPLTKLLGDLFEQERDSPNLTGSSLFQRACIALHHGEMHAPLKRLGPALLSRKRHNDAIFVASLLQNEEQLIRAYVFAEEWGAAFHAVKARSPSSRSSSAMRPNQDAILNKWNASIAKPTAAWRTGLEKQGIRPPTIVKLETSVSE